ncbi:MAG TPA: RelA/SpoT family protein, partial [Micavibrio sp.]
MYEPSPLISQIKTYNPDFDPEPVNRAYEYAKKMHEGQTRSSGEPYYTHPMEVAGLLANLKMDTATIVTAILHDTLEDTAATYDEVKGLFGEEVANLINGVSKLSRIEGQTKEGKQAENFRKLVLAMSEDIRVLLVKLADRLHNMRTLDAIAKPEKRQRIARETIEIYVPLAERIGLHNLKEELEDLCFSHLNPEARESIGNRLSFLRQEGSQVVTDIIQELKKLMADSGIQCEVTGREKTKYSIWRKMQRKNVSFEQLSDIMAFRIVVENIEQCYGALGIVHSNYPTVPGRFKDYISTPKQNGYRSIHTTVIGPGNHRIEVQIRTGDMQEEADLGVAAHWAYKQGGKAKDAKQYRWLRDLLEILDQEQRPEEMLENTRLELFQDQVYCFTPKGDLIELPAGSTPVDFAYAVHSGVGDKCVGAKINGRIAPLNT